MGPSRLCEFLAPAPLLAVALMWCNDHIFKAAFHNEVTGKLSDLAFCFFGPLFGSALLGLLIPGAEKIRLAIAAVGSASLFTVLELSTGAQNILRRAFEFAGLHGLGFTRDLTDLGALLMIPLAIWYGLRRLRRGSVATLSSRVVRGGALGATLLVLAAESPPDQTCYEWAQPMLFSVAGDCGPAGLVVVGGLKSDRRGNWTAQVWNAEALGFKLDGLGGDGFSENAPLQIAGIQCPPQYLEGGWHLQNQKGGRTCKFVAVENGLVALCDGTGGVCRATLKMAKP